MNLPSLFVAAVRMVTVPGMKKMEWFVPQQLSEHCGRSRLTAKKGAHLKQRHVSQNCVVRDPYLYYYSYTRHKSYKFYGVGSKLRKSTLHWPREKLINRHNIDWGYLGLVKIMVLHKYPVLAGTCCIAGFTF